MRVMFTCVYTHIHNTYLYYVNVTQVPRVKAQPKHRNISAFNVRSDFLIGMSAVYAMQGLKILNCLGSTMQGSKWAKEI